MSPPRRRYSSSPLRRAQIAPLRIRRTGAPSVPLKVTPSRLALIAAIEAGNVKPGQRQHAGGWRWEGTTVTQRVGQMIHAGWCTVDGTHLVLTDSGRELLPKGGA